MAQLVELGRLKWRWPRITHTKPLTHLYPSSNYHGSWELRQPSAVNGAGWTAGLFVSEVPAISSNPMAMLRWPISLAEDFFTIIQKNPLSRTNPGVEIQTASQFQVLEVLRVVRGRASRFILHLIASWARIASSCVASSLDWTSSLG